jgi:ERCC4-related helicase
MHEPIKTFLSVRSRELALFRARHLSYLLKDRSIKAVPLTGLGSGTRRGVSRNDRFKNLSLFNSGEAHILVGTSAADEGIDITASQDFSSNVGSHRRDKQQKGRVGRSSFGRFTHLCSSPKSYGKALNLIRKDILFVDMLRNERSNIIQELQVESRALKQRLFDFE